MWYFNLAPVQNAGADPWYVKQKKKTKQKQKQKQNKKKQKKKGGERDPKGGVADITRNWPKNNLK